MRVALLLIAFLLCCQASSAAEIRSVRCGNFEGHPRCVVELTARAPYRIANNSATAHEIMIEVSEITRSVDSVTGAAAGLDGWKIAPKPERKAVVIHLTTERSFRVADFTMDNPPRIVIDLLGGTDATIIRPVAAPAPLAQPARLPSPVNDKWMRRIIIDPGHGGYHKGGIGMIGKRTVYEKQLTIEVAEKFEKLLQRDPRFEVRLTRREDLYMGLLERTIAASQLEGDLFISIHANAVEGKQAQARARGFEIWTWNRNGNKTAAGRAIERLENDDPGMSKSNNRLLTSMMEDALESQALISRRVAQAVHSRAVQHPYLGKNDRGIDSARFKVLEIYDMPSILVELGFMTHTEEVRMMFTDKFQQEWAQVLYDGVVRYYEQTDPTMPKLNPTQLAAMRR